MSYQEERCPECGSIVSLVDMPLDDLEKAVQSCYDVLVLAMQDAYGTPCYGALDEALDALRPVMRRT